MSSAAASAMRMGSGHAIGAVDDRRQPNGTDDGQQNDGQQSRPRRHVTAAPLEIRRLMKLPRPVPSSRRKERHGERIHRMSEQQHEPLQQRDLEQHEPGAERPEVEQPPAPAGPGPSAARQQRAHDEEQRRARAKSP